MPLPRFGSYQSLFLDELYDEPLLSATGGLEESARRGAPRPIEDGIGGVGGGEQQVISARSGAGSPGLHITTDEPADPQMPPLPNPMAIGRPWYLNPTTAVLINIVSNDPSRVLEAARLLAPELAREANRQMGLALQRQDTQLARRWKPLAPTTLAQRKRKGIQSTMPLYATGAMAQEMIDNRFGTDTTVTQQSDGSAQVTTSFGPRWAIDDQIPHNAKKDSQTGNIDTHAGKHGPRPLIPPRPMELTHPIRSTVITPRVTSWAETEVGNLANSAASAYDTMYTTAPAMQPIWSDPGYSQLPLWANL